MLTAEFSVERDDFVVHCDMRLRPGHVVAIVGPNGAGKTTVMRALAGLELLESGRIVVNEETWDDFDRGISREPAKRSTALVLADPLLFPHLSIRRNVGFGLRAHGQSQSAADAAADTWLASVGLADFGDRRPSALSTGQQQRASLVRALAVTPQLLLLDEPLSAQDPSTRATMRSELKKLLDGFEGMAVLVTHDPLDALTLADELIVMDRGTIAQSGTPDELVRRPASTFVAQLMGLNLLQGDALDQTVTLSGGGCLHVADKHSGQVRLAFPPHAVTLSAAESTPSVTSSARNRWQATVEDLQPFYGRVRVTVSGPPTVVAEITPGAVAELALSVGDQVGVAVKAAEIEVYPA
ncbi:MAG: ABC transporter ATP-binding protein [Candidatus Nanopelagicales bacterium]